MPNPDKNMPKTAPEQDEEKPIKDFEDLIEDDTTKLEGSQETIEEILEEGDDPEADEIIEKGRGHVDKGKEYL